MVETDVAHCDSNFSQGQVITLLSLGAVTAFAIAKKALIAFALEPLFPVAE